MTGELVQVKIQVPAIPEPTGNLDEVQVNIDTLLASYTGRVYIAEEIKSAKDDRAQVNKWDKQLAEAAKAIKDKYLEKVDPLLDRIAQMRRQVKDVSAAIDHQVKAVEEAEREEKHKALEQIYRDAAGADLSPIVPFASLLDRRWLNKTVPISTSPPPAGSCGSSWNSAGRSCGSSGKPAGMMRMPALPNTRGISG